MRNRADPEPETIDSSICVTISNSLGRKVEEVLMDINAPNVGLCSTHTPEMEVMTRCLVHEVRNPLHTLLTQAGLIKKRLAKGQLEDIQAAKKQLDAVETQIARLEKLAESFLCLDSLSSSDCELISIPAFLHELADFVRPESEACGIAVTVDADEAQANAAVLMDRSQLHQVLLNLARNAISAMEDGGTLSFEVASNSDGRVIIAVTDTGCGIPPEQLEAVFDPFFTTRSGGNGLGLAITRGILESYGGTVLVKSRLGEGSRFKVTLPSA
jgi:signal transduction histidine kinase